MSFLDTESSGEIHVVPCSPHDPLPLEVIMFSKSCFAYKQSLLPHAITGLTSQDMFLCLLPPIECWNQAQPTSASMVKASMASSTQRNKVQNMTLVSQG